MATNDESALTNKQSPGKPPMTSSQLLRTPLPGAVDSSLGERVESLKQAVESILKNTKWPSESENAANELLNTIKSSPNIPSNAINDSQDLIKEYILILEDVEAQLKDAKSKSGMKRWKLLEGIKSIASNRPSKCTLLFQTCQDDVSKVVTSINELLDNEREKEEDLAASGISPEAQARLTVPNAGRAPMPLSATPPKPSEQNIASNHSTSGASSTQIPPPPGPEDEGFRGPVRQETLTIARKTFKAAEIASGSIPVAGNFVAAAAKVGLAFVETIQTMDKNDDLAKDLVSQTDKLSKCLANFTKTPGTDQGQEIANHVDGLQKELQRVQAKVEGWNSLGRFNKAFHARDHGDVLKGHQGTIQTAMEEMQLLVGLDTRSIVIELKNDEVQEKQRRLLKCLGDGRYGAQGNSIQDVTCFPGTRVQILERIDDWIRDSSGPDRVLWLRGMAGRGKSTIASTVVESWKRRASCAIFHFRRGQNMVNTRVVCALARQLASSLVPEVRNAVLDSVRENEDIADERLEEQFTTLFVASLARLQNQPHPILIVVDALDECDSPKDAIAFIRLIHEHSASFPANVKFLLTTRPEAHLLRALEPRQWRSDDLDTAPDVSSDLERFIQQACKQIRDNDSDVPQTWPSSEDVNRLVEMSQGLFQWARTVITYVSDGSPVNRLRDLLGRPSTWSGLDELYHQILSKAFDTVRLDAERESLLHRVLGTLALAPYPISLEVIAGLYGDNEIFRGAAQADTILFLRKDILADLNSLLFISRSSADPIRLMHTSIHDLLVSERRCKQASYYINVIQHHQQLVSTCLDTMIRDLKENICNLSDLSKSVSEIQDTAGHKVPTALLYCCRSWSIHLTEGVHLPIQGTNTFSVQLAEFEVFSKEKVIFWLEVMSLAGATKDAIIVGKTVCQWLRHRSNNVLESDSLATLWDDVQRFITAFSDPIQFGPLHIYTSALPHCPVETELWKLYRKLAKVQTIKGIPTSTWSSDIWVRSISKPVGTVAFSPDGNVLASGSDDYTIRLWDTQTGTVFGEPFTGHSNTVRSVCFLPDGKVLASGSEDKTIRLWDAQTGTVIGKPLIGHSSTVRSVCFSPDGKVLASGSDDKTIRLWDTQTRTAISEPFTGHSHRVWSVCFSPDGNVLASGSEDNTIRLWDVQSGTVIGEPLTGHTGDVNSVCFSPDGKVLASGSDDRTIRRWDTQTGTVICEPLTGHNGWVWSICFSPDGMVLASGSKDETIRLWDTQTGMVVGVPLTGHSGDIHSVCFSPDGKSLASGSNDQTIRLWDTQTRMALCEPPTGHDTWVWSICLSPNGKVLASGDNSIRLWDTQTGMVIGDPLTGHSGDVNSVCFSPDGKVLASGSDDRTIRLWDTQTGTVIGEPLTGHSDWVRSVCFSPDGKVLASGSNDETVRLWDPQTGMALGEPVTGHRNTVYSVCFSQDGSLLCANYIDRIRVTWDVKTRQRCETPHSLPLHHQNPDFQDHWVVVSSSRLIWLPPQYWVNPTPEIFLSGNTLAVLHNGNFSLFDISRALEL